MVGKSRVVARAMMAVLFGGNGGVDARLYRPTGKTRM